MTQDVEQIAASLTSGERKVLLTTAPDRMRSYREVHGIPRVSVFRKGLITAAEWHKIDLRFTLTPLGLAVRAHLIAETRP